MSIADQIINGTYGKKSSTKRYSVADLIINGTYSDYMKKKREEEKILEEQAKNRSQKIPTDINESLTQPNNTQVGIAPIKTSTSPTQQTKQRIEESKQKKDKNEILKEKNLVRKMAVNPPVVSNENMKYSGEAVTANKDIYSDDKSKSVPATIRYGIDRAKGAIKDIPNKLLNAGETVIYNEGLEIGKKIASKILGTDTEQQEKLENKYNEMKSDSIERIKQRRANQNATKEYSKSLPRIAQTVGDVGETVGEVAANVAVSAINQPAGMILMGATVTGDESGRLVEEGVDTHKASRVGLMKGLVEVGTEQIAGGIKFKGKGALDDIVGNTIAKKSKGKISNFLLTKGYQTVGEIGEEEISNIAGYGIDKLMLNRDISLKEAWKESKETAKMTFLTTLTLNLIGLGGENYSTKTSVNQEIINQYEDITKTKLNDQQKTELLNEIDNIRAEYQNSLTNNPSKSNTRDITAPINETILNRQQNVQNQNIGQIWQRGINVPTNNENIENNQQILYNNTESESGINGINRKTGTNLEGNIGESRVFEKEKHSETRYRDWEQSIRPKSETEINNEERQLIDEIKSTTGKDIIFIKEDNKNGYYAGASLTNKDRIYINSELAKEFGLKRTAYHEIMESNVRFADESTKNIITSTIEDIVNDKNFQKQKEEFWRNQEGEFPKDTAIAKDIICDRFAQLKGEEIDYKNILSEELNNRLDMSIEFFNKELDNGSFFVQEKPRLAPSVKNNKASNIPPLIGKNVKLDKLKTEQIKESNIEKYNKYKKNIIKGKETEVNSLITYKNETLRNIDNKISEKEIILKSKNNKDTKAANIIKMQIERLKTQRNNIQNLYNERIDKANSKVNRERIELQTRAMMKESSRKILSEEISPLVEYLTKYKDKKAGILFNREIAQRNIDDIVKDKELATAIKQTIFDPVQVHQANKTKQINEIFDKINSLELDKTKQYRYVPENSITAIKIDEATLAQLVIEKKITDKDLRDYGIDDKGIKKIHKTADTFTNILESLYNQMNEEQVKFGYSPIGKIENYFPHFFENKPDTMLGKIASYFGIDVTNQNLPTEIAGLTDTFKPGKTWDGNTLKRRTNKTDYDALTAMQKYVVGATDIIHTTEDIQRIREYSRQIRYKFSDEGMQTEIDKILNNSELTQEAKDASLEGIFKNTKSELSNFVTWLDNYANTLANKKDISDRGIEQNIGRNIYNSMSGIESRIAANTIGGNLSVSLTNFAPLFQAAGTTKLSYLTTGMLQTASNSIKRLTGNKDTSFVNNSNFLTNRFGTDTINKKTTVQKISDIASIPMNAIDNFTSESIVRAKYLENLDKGMSEEIALDKADKYAAKIMADRSKGALPLIFNKKNSISKLITMFQVEPNNMVSNYLKDMPREAKNKTELTKQAAKLVAASYAFNTITMAIRGGNEVLPDPIRWISYLVQAITGDDDEKDKAKKDLSESIVGSIPFLSNLAGFVGMEDVGRVPISNAIPSELTIKEFLKSLLYLGLPTGGAQLKKTVEGISTVINGGSYKTNKKGEKEIQFAVEDPNAIDYIKAGVFGKYSLEDSKIYANRGYKALSGKQTATYEESKIPFNEFVKYIDKDLKKKEDKLDYINSQNWNTNQKWGVYKNDILSNTERLEDGGSQRSDAEYMTTHGVSKSEYMKLYDEAQKNDIKIPTKDDFKEMKSNSLELKDYMEYVKQVNIQTKIKRETGELTGKQGLKDKDKVQILLDSNFTDKQKSAIYENYILSEKDTTYKLIKKTGIKVDEYLKYTQQEFESDKKDDGTVNGKTVSGSEKKKVYSYVNNMDIEYGQRLMLLGMKYTLQDAEQTKLYNYVKTLDYSQDEMQKVFEKLKGFTVYKNGRVTW